MERFTKTGMIAGLMLMATVAIAGEDAVMKSEATTDVNSAIVRQSEALPKVTEMIEASGFSMEPVKVSLLDGRSEATFSIPRAGTMKLALFDRLGREVMVLHDGALAAGNHTFKFRDYRLPIEAFYLKVNFENGIQSIDERVML